MRRIKEYRLACLLAVFVCHGLVFQAMADVSYKALAIEQRRNELKNVVIRQVPRTEDKAISSEQAFEQEKKTVTEQLQTITGDEDVKYSIVSGDTVQVNYTDQGKVVSNIYQVNTQGEIAMPLIGQIKLSGMNRGEARTRLNELMGEYIRNPQLNIEINASGKYTILGAAGPGVFELKPDLHLMEALVNAGIDNQRANLTNVLVMRRGKDKPEVLKLNIKKMMRKGDRSDDIALKPNDLIYVPNSLFYDAENFKDKMFSYLADYYTLGGSMILTPKQKKTETNINTTQ